MTTKHIAKAKYHQKKGSEHESAGLFNLATFLYKMARNQWKQTSASKDDVAWCDKRISHCQSLTLDEDDDNQ